MEAESIQIHITLITATVAIIPFNKDVQKQEKCLKHITHQLLSFNSTGIFLIKP